MHWLDLATAMYLFITGIGIARLDIFSIYESLLAAITAFTMFCLSGFFADRYIHYIITLFGDLL